MASIATTETGAADDGKSSTNSAEKDEVQSRNSKVSSRLAAFRGGNTSAKKCPRCNKTIYPTDPKSK